MNEPGAGVPIEVLLVEDNPADVVLTEAVLAEAKVANRLWVARDGKEAMEFLRREARQPKSPRPDLVLLDLNLPRKGGLEVLAEMKADRELRAIPVVVLTTSAAERDVLAAYDQHVNAYITKPVDLDQFVAVVRAVDDFWLAVVRLPRRS
jgi:two-component system, chemotaxis family, response regulator Rcp1